MSYSLEALVNVLGCKMDAKRMKTTGTLIMEAYALMMGSQSIKKRFWTLLPSLIASHLQSSLTLLCNFTQPASKWQDDMQEKIRIIKETPWVNGCTHSENAHFIPIPPPNVAPIPPQFLLDNLMFSLFYLVSQPN